MHDFQWVITDFYLRHLNGELLVTLAVLLAIVTATAILVAIELRRDKKDDHADQ